MRSVRIEARRRGERASGHRRRRLALARGQRARERGLDGAEHEVVHEVRVAEADLELGRMRVRVDAARVELEEHDERRLARLEQHVLISEPHRVAKQLVAHEAAVHERVLHVGLAARERRRREPALEAHALDRAREESRAAEELGAAERLDPRLLRRAVAGDRQSPALPAVVREVELDVEARQREILQRRLDVTGLGLVRALELAPRRRVEEKVADFDRGPERVRGGLHRTDLAAVAADRRAVLGARDARRDPHPRDRADARQRLTAKPERREALEVL